MYDATASRYAMHHMLMHPTADMCICKQEYAAQTKHAKEETASVQQALDAATVRPRPQCVMTCHVLTLGSLLDSRIFH